MKKPELIYTFGCMILFTLIFSLVAFIWNVAVGNLCIYNFRPYKEGDLIFPDREDPLYHCECRDGEIVFCGK